MGMIQLPEFRLVRTLIVIVKDMSQLLISKDKIQMSEDSISGSAPALVQTEQTAGMRVSRLVVNALRLMNAQRLYVGDSFLAIADRTCVEPVPMNKIVDEEI
jgi:hypothetical protein